MSRDKDHELLLPVTPASGNTTHIEVSISHQHRRGVVCHVGLVGIEHQTLGGVQYETRTFAIFAGKAMLLDGDMMHKAPKKLAALVVATFAEVRAKRGVVYAAVLEVAAKDGRTIVEAA